MAKIKVNAFYPSKPHEKQLEVISAFDAGERFVLLRAGRKWRKTSLMISWLIENALKTGLTAPYVAPSKVQAKNIVWNDHIQRILVHFKDQGLNYKVNEVELSITFPNGGKIQLYGVENKEALRGISNWCAIGCDEYDDWAEDIYPLIIRPNLLTHQAPALIAGTPKGYRNLYRLEQQGLFKCFHFRSHDNPELNPRELEELEKEYRQMGEGYYRQEILADYVKPYGTVYSEWELSHYLPIEYEPSLPLHITLDFGINDPTSIIWIQPNKSETRVIDYYEASNADINHFIQVIKSKPYREPTLITGDSAGNARELTSAQSPIAMMRKENLLVKTSIIPNIPAQIRVAHTKMNGLFISSSNPNCERFRDCVLNYRYPEKSSALINQSNEIPIHDEWSHAMRAFEYWAWNSFSHAQSLDTGKPKPNSREEMLQWIEKRGKLRREYDLA